MGSCVSTHNNNSGSALKLQVSSLVLDDEPNKSKIKEKPINVDPHPIISVGYRSQVSPLTSVASYRSYGSKEETFYDTQVWLDSDCDDDFHSVNGDFTPSRGSTPVHNMVATRRLNRAFSPQVNKALFESRLPPRSGSSRSCGSPPVRRSISATTEPSVTFPEGSNPDSSLTNNKRKKLADLFRESIRERNEDHLTVAGDNNEANSNLSVSETKSLSSSGTRTPVADDHVPENDKSLKSAQCCFPKLVSGRSFHDSKRASTTPPVIVDGLKA